MDKPKLYKKIKRGQPKILNRKSCREWHDNHGRNPLTNRVIKIEGKTYNRLMKDCDNIREYSLEMIGRDFIIEKSYGDGNCFFHSVLKLIYSDHLPHGLNLSNDGPVSGHKLRRFLERMFTLKDYIELLGGVYAQQKLNIDYPYQAGDELLNVNQLANKQTPDLKERMKENIQKNYEQFKKKFADWSKNADEGMIEFTARKLRLNILIYNTDIPGRFVSARNIIKNRSSIFIYNWNQVHFDPLRGDDGERVWRWKDIGRDIENL